MATIVEQAKAQMAKSVESTKENFSGIRTGRANPALLNGITVDYYGAPTPLKAIATIGVPEPRTLSVTPFDASQANAVEKALRDSDLGASPRRDGNVIRLTMPELTEERRKEYVKLAKGKAEDGKVAVRNIRRKAKESLDKAIKDGAFKDEIVPIEVKKKKETVIFDTDEHVKPNTTLEILGKLRPAFKKDGGTVTAGNASGINDAGAAMIIASEEFVKANGLKPLAKVRAWGSVGCDPSIMGVGPIESTRQALSRAGLTVADLDLIESNEAFAAQAAAVNRELGFDMDKVNVNGGAIALGHPIGAAGCRITTTLIYEMIKRDLTIGLATMCIGGGMGEAIIVERDELC